MQPNAQDDQAASDNLENLISSLNREPPFFQDTWSQQEGRSHSVDLPHERHIPQRGNSTASMPTIPSLFSSGPAAEEDVMTVGESSSTPLRSLSSSNITGGASRRARFETAGPSPLSSESRLPPAAEKDVDDPTSPVDGRRSSEGREFAPLTTLSKLFAGQVERVPSYNGNANLLRRSLTSETATLPEHLYTRGLLGGRHSDITITAFGCKYRLHRLILDRAPFFTTALSEPWIESKAKEITLHPEDTDANITQQAFELALKRLYGCDISEDEDWEAIGLFATGCWLEMQDLVESSIDAILRQMGTDNLAGLIRLVTNNYYGRAGERILSSGKAMLCRDGWEMPLKYWDGIPGDIIREMVSGDGFFIDGEWDRWWLAKRLLDRRLKQKAVEAGLLEKGARIKIQAPETLGLMAIRFDSVYRQNQITTGSQMSDNVQPWVSLYTNPDVEPLLALLDEGIHYIHLEFEQLQYIRQARDVFGLPVMPEHVITNALWQAMELRQKVMTSRDVDMELGLSRPAEVVARRATVKMASNANEGSSQAKGKEKSSNSASENATENKDADNWDAKGKTRKFWIPSADCNIVMGGNAEPVVTTSNAFSRHASRLSATLQPDDMPWATDFAASPATSTDNTIRSNTTIRPGSAGQNEQPRPIAYSNFPPFRFAAEFPHPRLLKEKKRVYSRTVFYAGSLWNIYIQKVRSNKSTQLGVYLHRAKEREAEEVLAGTAGLSNTGGMGSVDERIGLLEREMLLRRDSHRHRPRSSADLDDSSGSGGDGETAPVPSNAASSLLRSRTRGARPLRPQSSSSAPNPTQESFLTTEPLSSESDDDEPDSPAPRTSLFPRTYLSRMSSNLSSNVPPRPTIPPYVDARPTIKTYFKIYSPSKGGRLLSVYESAPDKFNFSQSWGWKSSTLMLDEGFMGDTEANLASAVDDEGVPGNGGKKGDSGKRKGEGKLRFMVVIGNL